MTFAQLRDFLLGEGIPEDEISGILAALLSRKVIAVEACFTPSWRISRDWETLEFTAEKIP